VDIDAEVAVGTGDEQRHGLAGLVPDGVGDQLAGEQDGNVRVDRNVPGGDGRPDLLTGLAHGGRSCGQAVAARV
jgi:hypothetical protein